MRVNLKWVVLVAMLAITGCGGGPRLDASSKEKLEASMKAMTAGMTEPQKREFARDTSAALGAGALQAGVKNALGKDKDSPPASVSDMYKPLDGLTAEEIHAKALENRPKTAGKTK